MTPDYSNFEYDPETGIIFRVSNGKRKPVGTKVKRYLVVSVTKGTRLVHRIAWTMHYGYAPPAGMDIDHIDGDGTNNRIKNLRLATRCQNLANKAFSGNEAGYKGVIVHKDKFRKKRYGAQVTYNYKAYFGGWHLTAKEAHEAYCRLSASLNGEFHRAV